MGANEVSDSESEEEDEDDEEEEDEGNLMGGMFAE
jgi:ribosomal protein L12E/L44/L45/RPP1/RPP2